MKKAPTGVGFFDEQYGGVHHGRAVLMTGNKGAGKTMFALQFLKKGLELDEPALILSARPSRDLAAQCAGIGIDVDAETERDRLFILNYGDVFNATEREQDIMLPPEGFVELKHLIEHQGIQRVVLDTILPWMNLTTRGHLAEHIFSFVRAFERMKTTTVFTLFQPASPAARKLRELLLDQIPVSVMIDYDAAAGTRYWVLDKFEGESIATPPVRVKINPKIGVVPLPEDMRPAPAATGVAQATPAVPMPERESVPAEEEELKLRPETDNPPEVGALRTPFARAMFSSK